MKRTATIGTLVGALALLTACSTPTAEQPEGSTDALATFGHVHGLGVDSTSGALFAAAHQGLFEVGTFRENGFEVADAVGLGAIAGRAQDTMGFEMYEHQMFASGHPDPREELDIETPNLGLIVSDDSGESWAPVALHGEVDFHDLAVAEQSEGELRVYGYDSGTGTIRVSEDSGETWTNGAQIPIRDLTVDAEDSDTVYATTEEGLAVSADSATTFSLVPDAPPLLLVEATDSGLVGVATDGAIWAGARDGSWTEIGAADGEVQAMTYSSEPEPVLVLLDARGIVASRDGGNTWETVLPA
jgi:hypothetical protein